MLRVAVIGSGPSGIYAAQSLIKNAPEVDGVEVDVIDRLPCPYGLVRYGVAPDHEKIKSITLALRKVLETDGIRFLGNIDVGERPVRWRSCTSTTTPSSSPTAPRSTGGSGSTARSWRAASRPPISSPGTAAIPTPRSTGSRSTPSEVVVVGVGNVAVDVARILAKTHDDLRPTDLPDHVLDVLDASAVTDIYVLGRRGPAQAKFTTKELRELGELANADIIVRRRTS